MPSISLRTTAHAEAVKVQSKGYLWRAGTAPRRNSRRSSWPTPVATRPLSILALKPLVAQGWVDLDRGIVCDAKSGVSGAGKAPTSKTHFMYAADNLSAYGVFGHRHTGELLGATRA